MDVGGPKSAPAQARQRLPFYRYSRFWFSLALGTLLISTAVMFTQTPRDPYDAAHMSTLEGWLHPIEPQRSHEMDTIGVDLKAVAVSKDGKQVWVGGNNGFIAVSTDGGAHWTKQEIVPAPPAKRGATAE